MPSHDEIRDAQRDAWSRLSTGWDRWDAVIMDQLRPVADAMIADLAITQVQQHLDVASGTGEPGLTIAAIAAQGQVVLTDLSADMLDIARRRAHARGIANVDVRVCSADDLPFPDAAFDSVSVRFGYMFLPDMAAATTELARVLRPGGTLSASVWVRPEENPWTSIVMEAIAAEVALPATDPGAPSMFRCAAPGQVSSLFTAAGLTDVAERDVGVTLVTRSPEEYWTMMSEHVSLAVAALRQVDEPARERIAAAVMDRARAYEESGSVRIPGMARCIRGTAR